MGFVFDFTLLLFDLSSVLLSLHVSIISEEWVWFQRSGSLLVLFSAILEIRQEKALQPHSSSSITVNGNPILEKRATSPINSWLRLISWAGIIGGTLIWGYGDLLSHLKIHASTDRFLLW